MIKESKNINYKNNNLIKKYNKLNNNNINNNIIHNNN